MKTPLDIRVEKLKQQDYNLSLNKVLDDAFNAWKKILFFGIFYILFSYLFNNLVNMFLANFLGTNSIDSEFRENIMRLSKNPAAFQKMVPIFQEYINNPIIIKKILFSSVTDLLIYPMGAGIVFCAYKADKKGIASFKDLIRGFQGKKFINLIGLVFIYTIVMIVSMFLLLLPVLYFIPAFILAGAFIIIDDAPLIKAIKCSFKVINMKFGQILIILILSFLISKVLGLLMCGIGIILTLPFSYAVVYSIYKNSIGTVEIENKADEF